jgi:DNA-binding transcriptional LysR family regulator
VAVVPKEHVVSATEEATVADLADAIVLRPQDDTLAWPDDPPGRSAAVAPATTAEAIELVAAGIGLLVVPQSLARLHHRRDLTYRPLADAPGSGVGLAWPDAENTELMEEFIGIVRGRTVNSSRTPRRDGSPAPSTPAPTKKSAARRPPARRRTHRR